MVDDARESGEPHAGGEVELPEHARDYHGPVAPPAKAPHRTFEMDAVRLDPRAARFRADPAALTVRLRAVRRRSAANGVLLAVAVVTLGGVLGWFFPEARSDAVEAPGPTAPHRELTRPTPGIATGDPSTMATSARRTVAPAGSGSSVPARGAGAARAVVAARAPAPGASIVVAPVAPALAGSVPGPTGLEPTRAAPAPSSSNVPRSWLTRTRSKSWLR